MHILERGTHIEIVHSCNDIIVIVYQPRSWVQDHGFELTGDIAGLSAL